MTKVLRTIILGNREGRAAFTVVELVTVLAILVVLVGLALPGLTRAQGQSRQAQCAGNLRQLTLAILTYAGDNADRLPTVTGGFWLWDIPPSVTDVFAKYGGGRQQFYCPANPDQNVDVLWNFVIGTNAPYRITGYVCTFPGSASLIASNVNASVTPQQLVAGVVFLAPQPAAKRVLAADAIISGYSQNNTSQKLNYTYANIQGGSPVVHHTSHMDPVTHYPAGGNVGMLDGHVEWSSFSNVVCRTTGPTPGFWW